MARTLTVPKSRQRAANAQAGFVEGRPLYHNIAFENAYAAKLTALTQEMTDDVEREVLAFYKTRTARVYFAEDAGILSQSDAMFLKLSSKWERTFDRLANPWAQDMVGEANENSARALKRSLKDIAGTLSISTKLIGPKLQAIIEASVRENVILIKSIPREYLPQVEGAVVRSITQPNTGGLKELTASINEMLDNRARIIHNKAKNVALDQTRKAYNNINVRRMQDLGLNFFKWLHSRGGQNPRPLHLNVLNGQIYNFNDLPVIDEKTGETGIPGQAIFCKCVIIPVVTFG